MLRGYDDRVDTHRPTVFVCESHLSLAVGTQPVDDALLAKRQSGALRGGVPAKWGRAWRSGVSGRSVAEHDALIARSETVARGHRPWGAAHLKSFIDAARDVGARGRPATRKRHRSASKQRAMNRSRSKGSRDVRISGISTYASVVTSPAMWMRPVAAIVSTATRERGSAASSASGSHRKYGHRPCRGDLR